MNTEKLSPEHLQRQALVYIRQSTLHQVRNNHESRRRQYDLANRAHELGFTQVEVIDTDLGITGTGQKERPGFERLLAAVCRGEVGAVFALEASRLARNNRDWHHLLELCRLSGSVVIDDEGIYDPRVLNDRLLLGLKGTMSEFEIGILHQRAQAAYTQKIARGEVLTRVPVGYEREGKTGIVMTADRQIQEAIYGLFDLFKQHGSLRQALLWYHNEKVLFPVQRGNKENRIIEWQLPNYQQLLRLVKNPTYAGAFAHGRTCCRSIIVEGRAQKTGGHKVGMDEWKVLIKDHHVAYISWDQYMANQDVLTSNRTKSHAIAPGAAREGTALLAGLLRCGKCGHKLNVKYRGADGKAPRYICQYGQREQGRPKCLSFGGNRVDKKVEQQILAACQPLVVESSLLSADKSQKESSRKKRALELALERARYDVERARKQYDAVDPENRLVAAELEKRWNAAIEVASEAETRLKQEESTNAHVDPSLRQKLLQLGSNLESIWHSPETPIRLKKRIIRTLVKEVVVDIDSTESQITLKIHWHGGVHTNCSVKKNNPGDNDRKTDQNVVEMVRIYAQAWPDAYIAGLLNRMRLKTGPGNSWNETRVKNLRLYHKIPVWSKAEPRTWLTMKEASENLGVSMAVVRTMIDKNLLPANQFKKQAPWLIEMKDLTTEQVKAYVSAHKHGRKSQNDHPSQNLIPYQ